MYSIITFMKYQSKEVYGGHRLCLTLNCIIGYKIGQTLTLHRYGTNKQCGIQQPYDAVTVGAGT